MPRYPHDVTQMQSDCGITHIYGLGRPYRSGKPKVRSDSGAAAFRATDDPSSRVACSTPVGSFTAQCKAQLC